MYALLALTPQGGLIIKYSDTIEDKQEHIDSATIVRAFNDTTYAGLLALAQSKQTQNWPAPLYYWRQFISRYLHQLCQQTQLEHSPTIAPPDTTTLESLCLQLPPMPGAEYCTAAILQQLWQNMDAWLHEQLQHYDDFNQFLSKQLPAWHQVGRICLHLAENKQDENHPFAFMGTFAASMGHNARVQYQPLSHAFQIYASQGDKQQLLKLLKPLHDAAEQCPWLTKLIESRDIYHPLAWTPSQAYAFLNSIPALEASGLVVRVPNWWQKRPRPRVQVTIGNAKQKSFSVDAMLDFDLGVALGDENLNQQELNKLLNAEEGLVSLRGQWVEVDKEKLQQALTHWEAVQAEAGARGYLLSKACACSRGNSTELARAEYLDENTSWAYVQSGTWLNDLLTQCRQPETIKSKNPGKLLNATLRPYQTIGANWLDFLTTLGLGACLADDMGLGKTIQVITLLLMKKQAGCKLPSLIVLPASLLSNWKSELERFAPSLSTFYLHSSELPSERLNDPTQLTKAIKKVDLVLTTYGMLLRHDWLQQQKWQLVILDEAQAIKNPTARQTKVVKSLSAQAKITLTGTPIENRLGDLWSLFDFLCPGLLGSATRFKQYLKSVNQDDPNAFTPLRKLVQPYILRRLKTDKSIIDDLPDKTEITSWCGLSKSQAKLYAQAVSQLSAAINNEEGIKRRGLVLSYLMRFKQICNHPSQALNDGDYAATDSGKFIRLREICDEIAAKQEKVLIFTQFKEMTEPLAGFLADVFHRPGLILHGSIAVGKRKKLVEQFQQPGGPPFFVLSLKAAGTGLNLTAANHVIHFDRWWNPAVEAQATDRAFRIGQKQNVLVHKFVCRGTVEEKVDAMIQEKVQLAKDVLSDGGETLLTELDDNALLDLVALDLEKAAF